MLPFHLHGVSTSTQFSAPLIVVHRSIRGRIAPTCPWPPYHVDRGLSAHESAVTVFAGEVPHGISGLASMAERDWLGTKNGSRPVTVAIRDIT